MMVAALPGGAMTAVRELTDALAAAGMDPGEVSALMMRVGAELAAAIPSKGALRTRKWRANRPSQSVTGDDPETPKPRVTERHQSSQNVTSDNAPLSSLTSDPKKHSEKKENKREANRGSRLPENWEPPESDFEATIIAIGQPRAEDELAKFRDHWKAQPGSKGVKSDWSATWRNWTRRAVEYGGNRNANGTGLNRANSAAGQSGSAAILAGVAEATERRARERAGPTAQRTAGPMRPSHAAEGNDAELFGARDG